MFIDRQLLEKIWYNVDRMDRDGVIAVMKEMQDMPKEKIIGTLKYMKEENRAGDFNIFCNLVKSESELSNFFGRLTTEDDAHNSNMESFKSVYTEFMDKACNRIVSVVTPTCTYRRFQCREDLINL